MGIAQEIYELNLEKMDLIEQRLANYRKELKLISEQISSLSPSSPSYSSDLAQLEKIYNHTNSNYITTQREKKYQEKINKRCEKEALAESVRE